VLTGRRSDQGQGKAVWTEGDRGLGKLKWRVYPMPSKGGERKDLKRGKSWRMSVDYWTTEIQVPFSLESSWLYFHFLFLQ
jgi:hypothetical protein